MEKKCSNDIKQFFNIAKEKQQKLRFAKQEEKIQIPENKINI